MITMSQRLRELREERGLKQQDIAEILNTTRATYSLYESGKNKPPIDNLIKLANFYKVSLDYLVARFESKE